MNRAIKARDLSMIYIVGPGHGGPDIVANAYMERTYSEVYLIVGVMYLARVLRELREKDVR
jgi:xylulose-5-phosphate/fructose-6-phosphate phosphoketolase